MPRLPTIAITLLLTLPIAAGLAGTALPAFGYLPAIGGDALSLQPWRTLFATPGIAHAIRLTLATGLAAALLSLALATGLCAATYETRAFRLAQAALAPILAIPHAAMAIGLVFLVAPGGWLPRLAGAHHPPDWVTVNDPWGVCLTLGLVLKEAPYLLLMILAALEQIQAAKLLRAAQALGYPKPAAWLAVLFPLLYRQLRLPIYAVLAFALSVVDVALILGPSNPPTLAVLVLRDATDPDIARWFPASAGALLLLSLVLAAIALWHAGEHAAAALLHRLLSHGRRSPAAAIPAAIAAALYAVSVAASAAAAALLLAWSLAGPWRFPAIIPAAWTLATWRSHAATLAAPALASLEIALLATACALALALAYLEAEDRKGTPTRLTALLYLPLLVPQLAFLFGLQILLDRAGLDGTIAAVVFAHLIFVLPYAVLSLADPWRAMDRRYARAAAALGARPVRVFLAVKLPLMRRPLAIAAAVAIAVSIGLYLPTVFAGAGRIATLTTEAVTLAGSGDRRVLGAYAALQALIPLLAYAAALLISRRSA